MLSLPSSYNVLDIIIKVFKKNNTLDILKFQNYIILCHSGFDLAGVCIQTFNSRQGRFIFHFVPQVLQQQRRTDDDISNKKLWTIQTLSICIFPILKSISESI